MKEKHSQYRCPQCGWWPDGGPKSPNCKKFVDLGSGPEYGEIRWGEHWICPHCRIEFDFENSNY